LRTALEGDEDKLVKMMLNAPEHWAGDHSQCKTLDPDSGCTNGPAKYAKDGPTHEALKVGCRNKFTWATMRHYKEGRESFMVETFNSVIAKFAPKRLFFSSSFLARLACAKLHWNENRDNIVLHEYTRKDVDPQFENSVRKRPGTVRIKPAFKNLWVARVEALIWGTHA
jgi:hypothetical protein